MSALTDALNYLLDRRTAIGFDIGGSILAPGLPRLKIIETIQAISDQIPEELIDLSEWRKCFDSLTAMFQTIAVCFDEDLYLWDTDLETIQGQNYERYCQIHKQHNPNSSPLRDAYFCEDL